MQRDKQQLKRFFATTLQPDLETIRRSLKRKNTLQLVFLGAFVTGFMAVVFESTPLFFAGFVAALLAYFHPSFHAKAEKSLLQHYQQKIVKPFLHEMDRGITYSPRSRIKKSDVLNAGIIKGHNPIISSNNFITFTVEGTPVEAAHVTVMSRDHDDDGGESSRWEFSGLFGVSNFKMNLRGTTQVVFDFAEKQMGFVGKGMQPRSNHAGLKRVSLDDTAFEKEFIVYAQDPIEANVILSHTVMEKLTALAKEFRFFMTLTFKHDRLYIALSNGYGFFQPETALTLNNRPLNFKDIEHNIDALALLRHTVEAVNFHHQTLLRNESVK